MNRNDQQFMAQKIRAQYMEKQPGALDELRRLDRKVKRPANAFAYVFGSIGALIMGAGMSLVMTDVAAKLGLGDMMIPGIVIGLVGLACVIVNYPIYGGILRARRKKYAEQILALSDSIVIP